MIIVDRSIKKLPEKNDIFIRGDVVCVANSPKRQDKLKGYQNLVAPLWSNKKNVYSQNMQCYSLKRFK
jgi:hypothetical protein